MADKLPYVDSEWSALVASYWNRYYFEKFWAGCAKTAEWFDVLFGVETHGAPRRGKGGFDAAFAKLL